MHSEETKRAALAWHDCPPKRRSPKTKTQKCRQLGIDPSTLDIWIKERDAGAGIELKKFAALSDQLMKFTDEEIWAYKRHVYNTAMMPMSTKGDRELFGRLEGLLIDKSEHKVRLEVDADELARIDAEADRRVKVFRKQNGEAGVQEGPNLLLEEVCEG